MVSLLSPIAKFDFELDVRRKSVKVATAVGI